MATKKTTPKTRKSKKRIVARIPCEAATKAKDKKKTSGLDAAVRVLRETGTVMSTGEMVEQMLKKGYWQTSGKTPSATIYAAILRECATKGDQARFRKTGRGRFELTEFGKEG